MSDPRSVALVGASPRATAAASIVRTNLSRLGYRGSVHLVNPKYDAIGAERCHSSLEEVEEPVDAVFVGVGGPHVLSVVEQAAALGVAGVVVNAANVPEADLARMADIARAHKVGICGPNTVGWLNLRRRAGLWTVVTCPIQGGPLAAITHSGTVAMVLTEGVRGVGFDAVFTCGNEVGLSAADYLDYVAGEDSVRAIVLFLEAVRDPEGFEIAAQRAAEAGKQIFAVKVGRSTKGAALVATHSGALAGDDRMYRAFLASLGIRVVDDLDELMEAAVLASEANPRKGSARSGTRAALLTLSGGLGALAVDLSEQTNLVLPGLTNATKSRIREAFPSIEHPDNPLDAWGAGWDADAVAKAVAALAAQDDIDVVAALLDAPQGGTGEVQEAIAIGRAFSETSAHNEDRTFVIVNANGQGPPHPHVVEALRPIGVVCLSGLRPSLRAIASFAASPGATGLPDDGTSRTRGPTAVGTREEWESLLERFGVHTVPAEVVVSGEHAVEIAARWGYPVVLKAWHPRLLHKTELALVRQPIHDSDALVASVDEMEPRLRAVQSDIPDAVLVLQQYVPHDLELILGVRNVSGFGSYTLVGMGGLFAEAIDAVVVVRGPIDESRAREVLASSWIGRLFRSSRAERYQLASLARQLSSLSQLGAAISDQVLSLEVNPLVPDEGGEFVALDFAAQQIDH